MARQVPTGPPPPPVVQRVRVRYAKRGRLRFSSHRDFARAFERALRRADVPMGYSAGFSPHPKISYIGAAPTGVASEAEYLEIGLAREVNLEQLRCAIDSALPDGLDILEVTLAGTSSLAQQITASLWRIELLGVSQSEVAAAVSAFLAVDEFCISRRTKTGVREVDARTAVVSASCMADIVRADHSAETSRVILEVVVKQAVPAVRPDEILAALRAIAGLAPTALPIVVRVAQGPLDDSGVVGDPLVIDRNRSGAASV